MIRPWPQVTPNRAFQAKYGLDPYIAGSYMGSLSNAGERIRLVDALGQTIHDFEYNDDGYDLADGDDFSLTVWDAVRTDPNYWNARNTWCASTVRGGSLGY